MKTKTITLPTIDQVEFELICEPEQDSITGNILASGDDKADKRAEQKVLDQLKTGNFWAWCSVEVRATYKGLVSSDYLGHCSYKSQKDFERDGYYSDMKAEAFAGIIKQIEAL